MQCPECQHKNPVEAVFCNSCGNRLELSCPSCGQTNPPGAKFCNKCGLSLSDTDVAASAQYASPETYTPKYLAERILTSKTSLEGERKQVTVLFADLKGSMEMLGDRDPEEARSLLDNVLTRMMEAVHRYEGTVNQVMGDGIMALFGAPLALEDHALRACYAALAIQNSMQSFAEEARREHGVTIQTRVGMNSGEVVVRTIGSDLRMGLHGRRPDDKPCCPDGADGPSRKHLPHRRYIKIGRGLRSGRAAWPSAHQGDERGGRGIRAQWRGLGANALSGHGGGRAQPIRRANERA